MSEKIKILAKNLMILASAGSGKTYQLGNRVIGLAGVHGVDPERIVALTFTRKAAGEFADEVLRKLARCARDPAAAAGVAGEIGAASIDFPAVLEQVVKALPRFRLGTIDSFFARVVRCFPHELGLAGGQFELLQGPRLEAALDEILGDLLGRALDGEAAEGFLHAFRRATAGREPQGVARDLREFLATWHGLWKAGLPPAAWGANAFGDLPAVEEWEQRKHALTGKLRRSSENKGVADLLDLFEAHTIGSGGLGRAGVLFERIREQVPAEGLIGVAYNHKQLVFPAAASAAWRELFRLCAACELAAAVGRTAAVREVVACYDGECARRLRARGLLGFDDIKQLMAGWARDEESRLRREQVDFRLDARYDHWLLDEFQDTSVAEWTGLQPLLDEAASAEDGSLFLVGDTKQAIYAFKGGEAGLFGLVRQRYGGGIEVATMPRSFRSCGAVLQLVNRVCGDLATVAELFGAEVAARWQWEEHEPADAGLGGEARVETLSAEGPDRLTRTAEILRGWRVGGLALTCGVLVRTNREVREVAEFLREQGFDVVEEGSRHPTADNLPGVALRHLLRWLADPADSFAREVVEMSPLAAALKACHGEPWQARWEGLAARALAAGFATALEELIRPLANGWSEFNRRRVGDVIAALGQYDAEGGASAREAARRLDDLEVPQPPGVAAVQVMTIHKAKGLGFDVVVIPEVANDKVPDLGHYEVARGRNWAVQAPAAWVRSLFPPLGEAEEEWGRAQRYDALCLLYVALTRAKRALHVLLPPPPKSAKDEPARASLAEWVTRSCGEEFQTGDPAWLGKVPEREVMPAAAPVLLGRAVPRRPRRTPSGSKAKAAAPVTVSQGGMEFGTAVHAAFERIGWCEDADRVLGADNASKVVRDCLAEASIREWFERRPGREVFREQAVEAVLDGAWVSGVIDRLVIDRAADGSITAATVIDFKTDAVAEVQVLEARYAGQMEAYRRIVAMACGIPEVATLLVSTHLRQTIRAG